LSDAGHRSSIIFIPVPLMNDAIAVDSFVRL
jgi:hypothetical protein